MTKGADKFTATPDSGIDAKHRKNRYFFRYGLVITTVPPTPDIIAIMPDRPYHDCNRTSVIFQGGDSCMAVRSNRRLGLPF
jgi:hypothetical protein